MRQCNYRVLDKLLREHNNPAILWVPISDTEEQLYYWDYIHGYFRSAELRRPTVVQQDDTQFGT